MTLPTFYLLYHEIKNKKREAKLKTQFIFKYIFTFYKLFLQKNKRLENSSLFIDYLEKKGNAGAHKLLEWLPFRYVYA